MSLVQLVSGTHVHPPAGQVTSRTASAAALLLGLGLLLVLPALLDAAPYVAVLGGAAAAAALTGGSLLWHRPTLAGWTSAFLGSSAVFGVMLLELVLGLPGAGEIPRLGPVESGAGILLATVVLTLSVLTVVGRTRREHEDSPPPPYAL